MGRKVKVRENYRGDAIALDRLLTAITADPACSPDWKAATTRVLRQAFTLLMLDHTQPIDGAVKPLLDQFRNSDFRKAG